MRSWWNHPSGYGYRGRITNGELVKAVAWTVLATPFVVIYLVGRELGVWGRDSRYKILEALTDVPELLHPTLMLLDQVIAAINIRTGPVLLQRHEPGMVYCRRSRESGVLSGRN